MKGLFLVLAIFIYNFGYNQVFTVDNCYIVSNKGLHKSPLDFNEDAMNSFIAKFKPPIEISEQKIEGHVFVNLVIKNNKLSETSLMIGISSLIDSDLVNYFKNTNISWIGSGTFDPIQRIVISIKVNYRYCSLQNVSKSNLSQLSSDNEINKKTITQFKNVYNNFDAIYFFDSTNFKFYRRGISKSKAKKINDNLSLFEWYKPEYQEKEMFMDYDKNKIPNVIIQLPDSVFIVENDKLIFSEQGHLKYIRKKGEDITIELESFCSVCKKNNKTLSFYKKEHSIFNLMNTITSYSNYPQLSDTLFFIKSVTTRKTAYIRSNPFAIDEPYNKCTGTVTEEYSCFVSKTWGNIFGEIECNTKLNVIHEFVDIYKKKWYFVLVDRIDGLFLGWVSDSDVQESSLK